MSLPLLVCDLDGTLCDDTHRVALALAHRYDEYHGLCAYDPPVWAVKWVVESWPGPVLFLTGRTLKYKEVTLEWINNWLPALRQRPFAWHLIMRRDGNLASTTEVKQHQLEKFLQSNPDYAVALMLEDRTKLVRHWRALGYSCWQVRDTNH